jgi:hypothetical protein
MIINPFKKHDVSEFPGVLVSLESAHHRNSITAQHRNSVTPQHRPSVPQASNENEKEKRAEEDKSARRDSDTSRTTSVQSGVVVGMTIESLRAEVEADIAAGDDHSSYTRKRFFLALVQD